MSYQVTFNFVIFVLISLVIGLRSLLLTETSALPSTIKEDTLVIISFPQFLSHFSTTFHELYRNDVINACFVAFYFQSKEIL